MIRKILILGGAKAQVQLIKAAKSENYNVVLCDFTDTNPGIAFADIHYKVNYMDMEKVLEIAKNEKVEGVISNSEYAMPTVSFVCDQLNLVGNSSESLECLNDKKKFRAVQKRIGLFAPQSIETSSFEDAIFEVKRLKFPVIVKPSQSSGSRGTTIVETFDQFTKSSKQWDECKNFSRSARVVVEEFVEMPSLDNVIDGDIFVYKGKILFFGLFSSKRSIHRPMIPMTQSYPVFLDEEHLNTVKNQLQKIVTASKISFGQLNVEAYFTKNDELFFIEINARQGGNGIPEMVEKHMGIDFTRLLVTLAVNDENYLKKVKEQPSCCRLVSRQPLFWMSKDLQKSGCYHGINLADSIKKFVVKTRDIVHPGTVISPAKNATDCLAWIDLEFKNREEQCDMVNQIEELVTANVEAIP